MDPATLTAIIQGLVTIISTLSGVWAIFNKKTEEIKADNQELRLKLTSLDYQLKNARNNETYASKQKPL